MVSFNSKLRTWEDGWNSCHGLFLIYILARAVKMSLREISKVFIVESVEFKQNRCSVNLLCTYASKTNWNYQKSTAFCCVYADCPTTHRSNLIYWLLHSRTKFPALFHRLYSVWFLLSSFLKFPHAISSDLTELTVESTVKFVRHTRNFFFNADGKRKYFDLSVKPKANYNKWIYLININMIFFYGQTKTGRFPFKPVFCKNDGLKAKICSKRQQFWWRHCVCQIKKRKVYLVLNF